MDDHGDDGDLEYELVMPFVVCVSNGGPYDDAAFAAGWAMAQLDERLRVAARIDAGDLAATVEVAALPQADLIAMRHGYQATHELRDRAPEWATVTFTRSST